FQFPCALWARDTARRTSSPLAESNEPKVSPVAGLVETTLWTAISRSVAMEPQSRPVQGLRVRFHGRSPRKLPSSDPGSFTAWPPSRMPFYGSGLLGVRGVLGGKSDS